MAMFDLVTPDVKRQIWQSIGQFCIILVTGLLAYKGPSEIVKMGWGDALYQPLLQAFLSALGIWGISKVGATKP